MQPVVAEEAHIFTHRLDRRIRDGIKKPVARIIPNRNALGNSAPLPEFLGIGVIRRAIAICRMFGTFFSGKRVISAGKLSDIVVEAVRYVDIVSRHCLFARFGGSKICEHRDPQSRILFADSICHYVRKIEYGRRIGTFRCYRVHAIFAFAEVAAVDLRNVNGAELFSDLIPCRKKSCDIIQVIFSRLFDKCLIGKARLRCPEN